MTMKEGFLLFVDIIGMTILLGAMFNYTKRGIKWIYTRYRSILGKGCRFVMHMMALSAGSKHALEYIYYGYKKLGVFHWENNNVISIIMGLMNSWAAPLIFVLGGYHIYYRTMAVSAGSPRSVQEPAVHTVVNVGSGSNNIMELIKQSIDPLSERLVTIEMQILKGTLKSAEVKGKQNSSKIDNKITNEVPRVLAKLSKTNLRDVRIDPEYSIMKEVRHITSPDSNSVSVKSKTVEKLEKLRKPNLFLDAVTMLTTDIKAIKGRVGDLNQRMIEIIQVINTQFGEESIVNNRTVKHDDGKPIHTVRWCDINDEDIESDEEILETSESLMYPVLAESKSSRPRPKSRSVLTEKEKQVEDLTEKLSIVRQEQKEERKRASILKETEKELTREQLKEKWLKEAREKRLGPINDRHLTKEETEMTKASLRKKWAEEAQRNWVERQRSLGYELTMCSICGRWQREGDHNHWCRRTGVKTGGTNKAQYQELVVSGNPSVIKVSRQTVVDVDQVDKELEKWSRLKDKLTKQGEAILVSGIRESDEHNLEMEDIEPEHTRDMKKGCQLKRPFPDGRQQQTFT